MPKLTQLPPLPSGSSQPRKRTGSDMVKVCGSQSRNHSTVLEDVREDEELVRERRKGPRAEE